MKIVLISLMTLLITTAVRADTFIAPTESDLIAVSLNLLEQSKKIMSSIPKDDCDNNMSKEVLKAAPKASVNEERVVHCLCELNNLESKDKKLFESLIGEYEGGELTLNTGNDNFFHGALQLNENLIKYDGDDRGRTFNGGIDYTLYGSEGQLRLNFDSAGFSKFSSVNGYRRSSDGDYYIIYREVNTLKLSADKYLSKDEAQKTFLTGQFRFTNETDQGNLSKSVQQSWHNMNKESMRGNVIQYKYLKEDEDKNTVTLMGGIGKEWYQNLGNWKCDTGVQVQAGMSVDNSKNTTAEIMGRIQNKLSHKAAPWLALSTWVQGSNGFQGPSVEGGVMLSVEKKIKNVIIKPFIGIERHRTPMDKKFGTAAGNPYENYHVLGVTIKY